jgi:hypothetical protein
MFADWRRYAKWERVPIPYGRVFSQLSFFRKLGQFPAHQVIEQQLEKGLDTVSADRETTPRIKPMFSSKLRCGSLGGGLSGIVLT